MLPLTLEGNTSVLHQALCQAPFSRNSDQEEGVKAEDKFLRMIKALFAVGEKLSGAGVDANRQDRLGRTILHLAAQFGFTKMVEELLKSTEEGGFGADASLHDLAGNTAIHYAIEFKQQDAFVLLLEHFCSATSDARNGANSNLNRSTLELPEKLSPLKVINQYSCEMTLASHCVVR